MEVSTVWHDLECVQPLEKKPREKKCFKFDDGWRASTDELHVLAQWRQQHSKWTTSKVFTDTDLSSLLSAQPVLDDWDPAY